jgi:hypothetical protein
MYNNSAQRTKQTTLLKVILLGYFKMIIQLFKFEILKGKRLLAKLQ